MSDRASGGLWKLFKKGIPFGLIHYPPMGGSWIRFPSPTRVAVGDVAISSKSSVISRANDPDKGACFFVQSQELTLRFVTP